MTRHVAMQNVKLPPALIAECLAHMDAEQHSLSATLEAMRQMRTALVQRNQTLLADALQQQRDTVAQTVDVMRARQQLRQRFGAALRLPPHEITFRTLAECAHDEQRDEIHRRRKQLLEMAAEIDLLNRANAALARQAMDLLGQVLACLTGDESADRYDHAGKIETGSAGPIVQTNC